jgi:nicotinamidase-related amidase
VSEPTDTALLIVDMISDWTFPDGASLLDAALDIAPRVAALKARCRRAGLPTIYANDNQGRWRSQFSEQVDSALRAGGAAERIATLLAPTRDDYAVLKPRHSAFFATPLQLLLQHLKVRRLVLAGVTTDQCVLLTAADAHMLGFDVRVPADGTATHSRERHARALRHLEEVLEIDVAPAARLQV